MRRNRRPVPGASSFDSSNPVVYLGTLAGARKARARAGSLVAPLDLDPELLQWPVSQLTVLLVGDSDHAYETARIAGCMLRDGAEKVVVVGAGPARVHVRLASTAQLVERPRANVSSEPDFS